MSGDVQPRKRKDKRKKKGALDARRIEEYSEESANFQRQSSTASDDEEMLQHQGSIGGSDEVIHIHKESKLGGNICSKVVFFGLLGILGVMVGLIIIEYHGSNDMETQSAEDSPWSVMLEGWVDKSDAGHEDEHLSHDEEHDENEEHDHLGNGEEGEYSEGEHEDEEETEEEVEDVGFVQKTYEDLRAAYNQITPEESDVEPAKDVDSKADEDVATESDPELSETEEEEEEEEVVVQEGDPLGQWKSATGPELLAEEVEEAQTESETEEESDEEVPPPFTRTGAQSIDDKTGQDDLPSETSQSDDLPEEAYDFADITNQADWEIKEDLDEADRDLDEGDFPV